MVERSQKVEFSNGRGDTLAARLELPAGDPTATALFAHCFTCSKDVAAASRISRGLREQGWAVLRFDFTGLGNSEGDFANTNFSSNVSDLVHAAEYLREEHEAPQLLVGHSLGGAAVLTAAAKISEVRAVATIGAPSAPQHVEHLFSDRREEIEAQGSAEVDLAGRKFRIEKQFLDDLAGQDLESLVGQLKPALLVFHSPIDQTVSVDHARALYQAAKHPKSFVSLDGADHLLTNPKDSRYVAEVLAVWAKRYVVPNETANAPAELDPGVVEVVPSFGKFGHSIRAGNHTWIGDEPTSVGGDDKGPTPYDFLLAALGTCTAMTLRMYADRKEWPFEGARVLLSHDRIHAKDCEECESETGRVDRITRKIEVRGDLTEEQRARLMEIADRCPVHRTLENEIIIPTEEIRG